MLARLEENQLAILIVPCLAVSVSIQILTKVVNKLKLGGGFNIAKAEMSAACLLYLPALD